MAVDTPAVGNVNVAVTGAVYVGPTGTTAPTAHGSTLNAAFKGLGFLSEDGITEARDRSTDSIRAWQNAQVVRESVTEAGLAFTFAMIETKLETVELYYGTTVDTTTGLIILNPAATGGNKSFVIDIIDGADVIRTYIEEGEVTETGDVVYANGEAIGYEVTVTAYTQPKRWYSSLIVAP